MSLQRECLFFEPEPGQWYMLLDDSNIAHQWDWRENADCYGPFPSLDRAEKELDNHANPGGCSTLKFGEFQLDDVYRTAIRQAIKPVRFRSGSWW